MNELYKNHIFNIILLMTIIGEFFLPWMLKYFYPKYNSKTMVMSVLGNPESPVKLIYNAWLVWLGVFLLFTAFIIFPEIKQTSVLLAVFTWITISVFAIGAGIIAGIFSVNSSKEIITLASKIHGIWSALGFMTLLFFPLLSSIIAFKSNRFFQGTVYIFSFILALIFFIFFIMGDKKEFQNTIFIYEGLWERLTLFFMYIPFIYRALFYIVN